MIISVAASAPVFARTALLSSSSTTTRCLQFQQALRITITSFWYTSSEQSHRPSGGGNDLILDRHIRQRDTSLPPPRSLKRMRSSVAATSRRSTRTSSASAIDDVANNMTAVLDISDIEDLHRQAILARQSAYIDPCTKFTVFTELTHLKRGKCCGNKCRHCPYGWSNVRGDYGDASTNARAISGDQVGTARLVQHILEGTYYEAVDERQCSREDIAQSRTSTEETTARLKHGSNTHSKIKLEASQPKPTTAIGSGKGGSAGGALTSKNVPYTRQGDAGTSQLFTGERRSKDDILFEALGTVDELCSVVGVVYAELNASSHKKQLSPSSGDDTIEEENVNAAALSDKKYYKDLPEQLLDVMSRLFDVGSHIAKPPPREEQHTPGEVAHSEFDFRLTTVVLEGWIDTMTDELPELLSFIIPSGSPASAQLHVARTVCRRAERRMIPLVQDEGTVDPAALAYVNRLSDYFFTAARFVNYCDGTDEVQYRAQATNSQRERVIVQLKN